jgi:hypothetical protein
MKKYTKYFKNVLYIIIALLVGVTVVYAGSLTPPGAPAKSMKSLSDLYELVNTGANTPSTDFDTPTSIIPTMFSLGDTYDLLKTKITAIDTAKILTGVTILGKAGSMPDKTGAEDFTPSVDDVSIPTGFYDGVTKISGDTDLITANIKSGTNIFGVAGSLITNPLYGDDDPDKVLNTASNPGNYDVNSCSTSYNTLNLSVGTVKSGTVFGDSQTGDYPSATYPLPGNTDTNALAENILTGYEAWNKAGTHISGEMTNKVGSATSFTPSTADQAITQGYYGGALGDGKVLGDVNLVTGNIKTGATIFGVSGSAPGPGLPKTGQTGCWNTAGASISCTNTGQDGDTLKGITMSFTDNIDGTITDNVTGLVWQKQDNATTYTWDNALTYCNANTPALPGSGWRLPNIKELQSIINYQIFSPAINVTFFPGTQLNRYWSSTTYVVNATNAWSVHFSNGAISNANKTTPYYVRCVRG